MDNKGGKIRIRRSSGKIQYVTKAELEELNERRKIRDQERGWGRVSNPVQSLFSIILVILGITVIVLWVAP